MGYSSSEDLRNRRGSSGDQWLETLRYLGYASIGLLAVLIWLIFVGQPRLLRQALLRSQPDRRLGSLGGRCH